MTKEERVEASRIVAAATPGELRLQSRMTPENGKIGFCGLQSDQGPIISQWSGNAFISEADEAFLQFMRPERAADWLRQIETLEKKLKSTTGRLQRSRRQLGDATEDTAADELLLSKIGETLENEFECDCGVEAECSDAVCESPRCFRCELLDEIWRAGIEWAGKT